jgi:hypothetical protein
MLRCPPSDCSCFGGVKTVPGMPSDLAPGSEVKLSGEGVLPVLLHREPALGQRAVEDLTGGVPVAVLRPGSRRLPLCHVDDRRSSVAIRADQIAGGGVSRRSHASAVGRPTYSGHRATAATGGGLCA